MPASGTPANELAAGGSSSQHSRSSHHSRRDPSEGGWDPTIVKAPDSHKGGKHGKRRKHRKKWPRVLAGVLIALVVLLGVGAGAAFAYINSLNAAMSLGDDHDTIVGTLTDTPATEPFYVLVMGIDLREYTANSVTDNRSYTDRLGTRSDVILLLRVDALNSQVTMVSVPRDTPCTFSDGTLCRLNMMYEANGAAGIINTVQDITGVKISHYAEIHGTQLEQMIDDLGGIVVDVPIAINARTTVTGEAVSIDAGLQRLSGVEALALSNLRTIYGTDQDMNRQKGARLVVSGIIDAIRNKPVTEIPGAVAAAAACVKTDMDTGQLVELVSHMTGSLTVYSGTLPYDGDNNPWAASETFGYLEPWLCYVNDAGMKRAIDLIEAGGNPGTLSYADDAVHFAGQPQDTWSYGPLTPDQVEALRAELAAAAEADSEAAADSADAEGAGDTDDQAEAEAA